MGKPRQLWQELRPAARLEQGVLFKGFQANLLLHPTLQKGLGGDPEVEVWVELSAQPLNVEQGLLEQHQLRLNFHIESSRCLKES